jgi:hypothetical protein
MTEIVGGVVLVAAALWYVLSPLLPMVMRGAADPGD